MSNIQPVGRTWQTILASVAERFCCRPDSEHEQAFVRAALVSVTLLYLGTYAHLRYGSPAQVGTGLLVLGLYLIFSVGIIIAIALRPGTSPARRYLCILGGISG